MTGIVPLSSSAVSEPIYIEDGAESWSKTVISGDINDDGKLSIADAVILQQCLMDNYSNDGDFKLDKSKLDVNFDGCFDAFDMVQMRQTVLHPETASTQTLAIDAFNSDLSFTAPEKIEDFNKILTSYDEMSAYLSTITADSDEIQKYLDRYDETFFEENNLILEPLVQNCGNGVFYEITDIARGNNVPCKDGQIFNGIGFAVNSNYEHNKGLYPQNKTNLLAQVAVPKSQSSADDTIIYLDLPNFFFSDTPASCHYTDGTHELVFVYNSGLHHSDTDIYLKNSDGSFTYIEDMFDFDLGEDNGELSGENYNITFRDDCFIVDYLAEGGWGKIQSSYDGENVIKVSDSESSSYESPDGQTKLYLNYRHYAGNFNSGDTGRETLIDMYLEEPDGHLKHLGDLSTEYNNEPFTSDGEWSVDSDGNNVFSNGTTYSITWLDDSVILEYQSGSWTATGTIPFDNSGFTIKYIPD